MNYRLIGGFGLTIVNFSEYIKSIIMKSLKMPNPKLCWLIFNKLLLLIVCIGFVGVGKVYSQAIPASKVTMDNNDLKNGYINLKIPIYDDDGNDEGISPTSTRAGKITVNGSTLLRFWSFHDEGDGQDGADWYWVRAQRTTSEVNVDIHKTWEGDYWQSINAVSSSFDADSYTQVNITKDGSTTWAQIRVCLPTWLLDDSSLDVVVSYYVDEDGGGDYGETSTSQSFSGLTFPVPSLNYTFSATPGKYNVNATVSPTGVYSKYEYSIGGAYSALTGSTVSIPVDITESQQSKTVFVRYTLGYCNRTVVKSSNITLPAYPQAKNFKATQLANGDVSVTWDVNAATGANYISGDQFEIQRADNIEFNNPVNVGKVDYNQATSTYSYLNQTSTENLNGTYYYRIRRTKTQAEWGWDLDEVTSVQLSMAHKYVASANVQFNAKTNVAQIKWNYNSGNVWTANSSVIIERYNLTSGGAKEVIVVPADSLTKRSFSEELFLMCNKFTYKIYVKPGNTNYVTQEALSVNGDNVVPLESGELYSINASKGYFSDRIELSWETDGMPIDYFSVKNRIFQSGNAFKQIAQVTGTIGSESYQFSDGQSNPGEIYEYQIIGVTKCTDVTIYTDTLLTYGFRTPTGDIYGRVTFENGQAEENVEVRLESGEGISGRSLVFDAGHTATINNTSFLETSTESVTVQAWIAPDAFSGTQKIVTKPGMYELGLTDNFVYFSVGDQTLNSVVPVNGFLEGSGFVHVTGVFSGDSLFVYINGERTDSAKTSAIVTGNNNPASLGGNYSGAVDEVRVWARALTAKEIARDYNRYITGGETGLMAYWSFNYATGEEFYDRSYKNSDYNENHGKLNGAVLNETRIPTNEQLGYKGVTGTDGSYAIRAVPYVGNGTLYTIIPRLGIHQFEAQEEVRFIGEGSETFTVNFIDKSSFRVTGTVTYQGGTVPVEGVSFTIDGITAMGKNGTVLMSDSKGEFEIQVPVGSHEVIAKKANHVFANGGRITDSYLVDLNYQDEVLGLKLSDITKVKYIGRVAGGALQDSYPVGFSLSENNLADGATVTLTIKNPAYQIVNRDTTIIYEHLVPSAKKGTGWSKTDSVRYSGETITIFPNNETGEFIAEVIPVAFTVRVNVPGHDDIPGSGEDLDLTQKLIPNSTIYTYQDSVLVNEVWEKTNYSDTVYFHAAQKFIKRYSPTVRITQLDKSRKTLPYFGDSVYVMKTLGLDDVTINLIPGGNYLFGKPVFTQNDQYHFKAEVFEKYVYFSVDGKPKTGVAADEVPTGDATIEFTNNLATSGITQVDADSIGVALYDFQVTDPELTSAVRAISAKIYYGSEENRTSINWDGAFTGIIIGSVQTGRDFITGGPDKVLMVLRDPPGSKSYSYLEKGVSVKEASTYKGEVRNAGSELFTQKLGTELVTFTGIGVGTINSATTSTGFTLGVLHEESIGGSNTTETTTTTTTRFQTSDDPSYVGEDADVFVGYSTNIAYGSTECVSIISKTKYLENPGRYKVYTSLTPLTQSWLIAKQTGLGLAQTFGTLFAYPQSHIINRLLPEMEALRNNFLMQKDEADFNLLQNLANDLDTVFYVSYLPADNPNFGKSNFDEAFNNATDPDPDDEFNGPSYRVIFPERNDFTRSDTILYLNQSIFNWYKQLKANEEAKINAKLLQNYSFQGGSPVQYSESYSFTESGTVSFDIMIGGNFKNETDVTIMGSGFKLSIDESLTTTHGGEFEDAETQNHSKGFVLAESSQDYISVDVMHENADSDIGNSDETDDFYPTFVFRTQAGATSCPYEDANVTRFFEPGQHILDQATKKIEVPEIAVENDFVENVPSGEAAYFTLYLRNNSEIAQDNWFTLKIVSASNPSGAKMFIDGAPIGNGLDFLVPAGGTLSKTLEVRKGSEMNYDNLQLVLQSRCQESVNDSVTVTVHYTPSCTNVDVEKPGDKWTYNTKLPVVSVDGVDKHYMEVRLNGFDVNYDSFNHIKLQYKSSAESDEGWKTLMKYYSDSVLYLEALENGNAGFIDPGDAGTIKYLLKMDDLPDQRYDLRAVSVCLINNEAIENYSATASGIKDMLLPRLFGAPQPANGILTIQDEIRLNFNEPIAEGLLTKNNFQVTGIRNGAMTDHSVSIRFDGINDFMETEFEKNMAGKDITVEMWINSDQAQTATLFNHGNINESIGMALTSDNRLQLFLGDNIITSNNPAPFEPGSWAHVAFVFSEEGYITGYYNFSEVISNVFAGTYTGIGNMVIGKNIRSNADFFTGRMHNVRIWNEQLTSGELQVNSLAQLSGNEPGLLAYYPMDRAVGELAEDKARGANLLMNGCTWSVPEGRAVRFNGTDSYVKMNTGSSAVIRDNMDYTIEFWFKGGPGQTNATLFSNGRGDGQDLGGSKNLFSIAFNNNGKLCFTNNGFTATADGDFLDNNWHHFALNVGRTIGRGQIYIDGNLISYFSSEELGGIGSAFMYLGARAWYAGGEAANLKLDNFFEGTIDEVRIWKLYKYEQQIQESNNIRLDGSEMGLLAYYPFEYYKEWQGLQELDFTLADKKIQPDPANTVPDAENFNAEQVSDTPPVKDKGAVSNLEFDFVVNNDALIVYLEETPEKIEKTIVTFTVDGVQDVNGNENSSPITWSAYIDRNMLRWSDTEITVAKPLNQSAEFTVQAVNKSGSVQNFYIRNNPSWMKITPSSGTIDPNTSISISFQIDEGLNIGTYNEMIYLVNSDNVSEVLDVTVAAKGDAPDWTVNPGDYKYNMQVYAKLRINNIFSKDPEDKIAAFSAGKCIGVANVQYEERNDMWYAFLIVYSNETNKNGIVFKIWDASAGMIYLADAGHDIGFTNNNTVGTPAVPQIFDAGNLIYQNIDVSAGWNWISMNVKSPSLNSLNELLANMTWNSSNFFKSEADNLSANYSDAQSRWMEENPFILRNTLMYKVSSSLSQTIAIAGEKIMPSSENIIVKGNQWNYIGYLPTVRLKLDEALAGYDAREEDVIKSQDEFAMFAGNIGWVGSLSYLEPGKGYMIFRNENSSATLKYPDSYGTMSTKSSDNMPPAEFVNKAFSQNMNLVAISDIEPQPGDRILAFTGSELSSEVTLQTIGYRQFYFITVAGNTTQPVWFALERNGEILGKTAEPVPFVANAVTGTLEEPVLLKFIQSGDIATAYPNPVSTEVNILLVTGKTGPVEIQVTDISGRKLIAQKGNHIVGGQSLTQIDCNSLLPGLYFVAVKVEGVSHIIKIEKQ